jgi:hypothetical protein
MPTRVILRLTFSCAFICYLSQPFGKLLKLLHPLWLRVGQVPPLVRIALKVEEPELRLRLLVGLELLGLAPDELPRLLPDRQLEGLALVVNVDVVD